MNAKTIAIAIALIAGTAVVSSVQASESIKTLSTVQVRPAADQLAQQAWEQASGIPTLATVEVRPSADQLAERSGYVAAPVAAAMPITTLASVEVRPSLEQRVARRRTGSPALRRDPGCRRHQRRQPGDRQPAGPAGASERRRPAGPATETAQVLLRP